MVFRALFLLVLLCVSAQDVSFDVSTSSMVASQYEMLPYPPRDPDKELERGLQRIALAEPIEMSHYVFGGRLKQRLMSLRSPFRILVAGGGTGDATVYLGQRFKDMGAVRYEIVHVDLSSASIDIARRRAQARQLSNIRFVQESLLNVGRKDLELGMFDYINVCGVLHHLPDPLEGLRALASVLKPDGGIGIMVYGELGRTGIYHIQSMLRSILPANATVSEKVGTARRLLASLPKTNWLYKNQDMLNCGDLTDYDDAGIYDLLLHSCDKPFQVKDIFKWTSDAQLRVTDFFQRALYTPATYVSDAALVEKTQGLSWQERYQWAELLTGHIKKHNLYVVHASNDVALPSGQEKDSVPCKHVFYNLDLPLPARGTTVSYTMNITMQMVPIPFKLPSLSHYIVRHVNCENTLSKIHELVSADVVRAKHRSKPILNKEFMREWRALYDGLHGIGWLVMSA